MRHLHLVRLRDQVQALQSGLLILRQLVPVVPGCKNKLISPWRLLEPLKNVFVDFLHGLNVPLLLEQASKQGQWFELEIVAPVHILVHFQRHVNHHKRFIFSLHDISNLP